MDYDVIGIDYADLRRPDPRIARQVFAALGDARSVINVGAGTGSYEPPGCDVTAVEPSAHMNRNRRQPAHAVVQASAEALPFDDKSFDAAMAILTVHHWPDQDRGLRELRRVSRGPVVVLTFDPDPQDFWLWDYFPDLVALDTEIMPPLDTYSRALGDVDVALVPIPHDCVDGFLCAFWRRPEAYLDPRIRRGMSSFWKIDAADGLTRLEADLASGDWDARHGALRGRETIDLGYRLITA